MHKKRLNEIRIIGGTFRHRKIYFPDHIQLRPTPNRVRETLFNWLAPYIREAHCLDLFAGSGALGIEALSRGAAHCVFYDMSSEVIEILFENKRNLQLENMEIHQGIFPYSLITPQKFDIIFVDPPFNLGFVPKVFQWLAECDCFHSETVVYVESERTEDIFLGIKNWEIFKDKVAGNVRYSLLLPRN